jgi:hypothetical protein
MENKRNTRKIELDVRILPDVRAEIDLNGAELLTLDVEPRCASITCTEGTLWLTQQNDQNDHVLKTGQSFTVLHAGTVLVQGMPAGKARILPPASVAA